MLLPYPLHSCVVKQIKSKIMPRTLKKEKEKLMWCFTENGVEH